jgi:hypothetical protein
MAIPFTQYLRPHGRSQIITIDMPDEIETAAIRLIDLGYRFEAEVLMNGLISMTCTGHDPRVGEEQDIALEVTQNNKTVPAAVARLVERAAETIAEFTKENPE